MIKLTNTSITPNIHKEKNNIPKSIYDIKCNNNHESIEKYKNKQNKQQKYE